MPNRYFCSDGTRVTEATIKANLSKAYREKYAGQDYVSCFECGQAAQGSGHILPRSVCKQLHKTELIWDFENFTAMCHSCNQKVENISSPEFKQLNGYEYYLDIFRKYCKERYFKAL